MTQNDPPVRKLGLREYIGGFALMAMGFGLYSWCNGRDIPWGYQQTYGTILFGVGLAGVAVASLLRRK